MNNFCWTRVQNQIVVTLATGVNGNEDEIRPAHVVNCVPSDNRQVRVLQSGVDDN